MYYLWFVVITNKYRLNEATLFISEYICSSREYKLNINNSLIFLDLEYILRYTTIIKLCSKNVLLMFSLNYEIIFLNVV